VADLLEQLGGSDQQELLEALDPASAGDALEEMEPERLEQFLRSLSPDRAATLLAQMEPDEAADALRGFDRFEQEALLAQMPSGTAFSVSEILNYPEAMAGGFMNPKVISAWSGETVGELRSRILGLDGDWSDLDGVVLLDEGDHMLGDLPIVTLYLADPDTPVGRLLPAQPPLSVSTTALVSDVARALIDSRRSSVVVTDEDGRPIGRVLADDLIDALVSSKGRHHHRKLFS
jgi:Mg/Co/Ni transporter MgtE